MVIKVNALKKLLNKSMQAVSNNKLLPLTSLIAISIFEDGFLQLTTYDGNNILVVGGDGGIGGVEKELYTVINANTFNALINKLSVETITIRNEERFIEVDSGNGLYKFDVAWEEDGVVKFPDIDNNFTDDEIFIIPLEEIKLALTVNEGSVAKTQQVQQANKGLTGAYFDKKLITTNAYTACITNVSLFKEPKLFNYSTLKLLSVFEDDKINIIFKNNRVFMLDSSCVVVGNLMPEVDNYPANSILKLLELDFPHEIKVNKTEILGLLSRINIFVEEYEKDIINFEVKDGELILTTKSSKAYDSLYIDNKDISFNCLIDYSFLVAQLKSMHTEIITIKFGNKVAILLEDIVASHIIALVGG